MLLLLWWWRLGLLLKGIVWGLLLLLHAWLEGLRGSRRGLWLP